MGDRNESVRRGSWRRRRTWIIVLALLVALVIVGFVADRAKTVDASEYDVLDQFIAEGFPESTYDVRGVQRSEASPCWWWCEDYQLDVDVRANVASDGTTTPRERCEHFARTITAMVGAHPVEPDGYGHRECFFIWWDFEYGGRRLRLDIDVSDSPERSVAIRVENLSARRAFLPYGG